MKQQQNKPVWQQILAIMAFPLPAIAALMIVVLAGCESRMSGPGLPEYDGTSITPEMDFCYKRNYSFVWIDNGWSAGCLTEEGPTRISKIMYFERKLMSLLPIDYDFNLHPEKKSEKKPDIGSE